MPFPKPETGETESEFISRCMSDELVLEEYPDEEQRAAACHQAWENPKSVKPPKYQDKAQRHIKSISLDAARLHVQGKVDREVISDQAVFDSQLRYVEGYASTFDNVDQGGDVVRKGAFKKTIKDHLKARLMKFMSVHFAYGGGTPEVIGTVVEAKEDKYGLWVKFEMARTQLAREAYGMIVDKHVSGLSIGYSVINGGWIVVDEIDIYELKELRLWEVTATPFPMNELAAITSAKALREISEKIGKAFRTPDEGRLIAGDKEAIQSLAKAAGTLHDELLAMIKSDEPQEHQKAALHSWAKMAEQQQRENESRLKLLELEVL